LVALLKFFWLKYSTSCFNVMCEMLGRHWSVRLWCGFIPNAIHVAFVVWQW
jgi:hypothetical protein